MATSAHFVRFALIGAIGTAVHFAVLAALVRHANAGAVLASQFGAVCGALTNYILNRRINYRTEASHLSTGPKFFVVVALGFALNGLLMLAFVQHWRWNYLLAQLATTALVLLWNFAANHFWTFAEGN